MDKDESPKLFRINIEVGDLDRASRFYAELLGLEGRPQMGGRCYFQAAPVTLQVVQSERPQLAAKALYFAVADIGSVHRRAAELGCLAPGEVHGSPAGEPCVKPWGELSFYAGDPWGNPLCFVEEGTIYRG
jgi:predicted enzyme related to lactoylglutathione lyase